MANMLKDLVGQKFNRLTVLEFAGEAAQYQPQWKCLCDCGNIITVRYSNLKSGHTKSCGCAMNTHGDIKLNPHFYIKWTAMRKRVNTRLEYIRKNITVDPHWNEYLNFKEDMYESYLDHAKIYGEANTTLDRKDNEGSYSKDNCRWATRSEQNYNKGQGVY